MESPIQRDNWKNEDIPGLETDRYLVAPKPLNEPERLKALLALELLDTPAEERFDVLTSLSVKLFGTPIAYIALVDSERQWFKSSIGLTDCETSRKAAFCSHTILRNDPLIIPDTHADPKYARNPLVTGKPYVRAYAGVPLCDPKGFKVGTMCLASNEPRQFSAHDVEILKEVAGLVERELQSHTVIQQQKEKLRLQEIVLQSRLEKDRLNDALLQEKERAESFLRSLMPAETALEWLKNGTIEPRYFPDVTVLFTDFVGFSRLAEQLAAEELVTTLNSYFSAFDRLAATFGLEKLKTIGDSYMCVGGLPEFTSSHPVDAVLLAIGIRQAVRALYGEGGLQVRIGIHTGPVVAGVVGMQKIAYDIWGETVNCSSRMESYGAPDEINLSERTYARVKDFFACEHRGRIRIKEGKELDMYFLRSLVSSLNNDRENGIPQAFRRRYRTYFRKELKNFPTFDADEAVRGPLSIQAGDHAE